MIFRCVFTPDFYMKTYMTHIKSTSYKCAFIAINVTLIR